MQGLKTITFALIAINVVMFIVEPKDGGFNFDNDSQLGRTLGFVPADALDKPWMFFTSMFLHGDIFHLGFNMFTLFMFGLLLESLVKPHTYLAIYFISGFAGGLLQMAMAFSGLFPGVSPLADPLFTVGVGASGAIMGVMGALAILTPHVKMMVPILPILVPLWVGAIGFAAFNIVMSFTYSGIGTGAHLGGLAVGLLFGLAIKKLYESRTGRVTISYEY